MDARDPNLDYRQWSPPATADREVRLAPTASPAGFPNGPRRGCVEAFGRWCNCDVWVQAPSNWLDVDFQLIAHSADISTVLDHRALRDMQGAQRGSGVVEGVLFSVRGRVADRFSVQAFNVSAALPKAKFRMECWGDQSGAFGDRGARQLVEPYARQNQVQRFASPAGGIAIGAPTTLFPTNPSGGRTAITSLEWTADIFPAPTAELVLRRQPGAIDVGRWYLPILGNVLKSWQPPIYTLPGETFEVQRTGGIGATHHVNATGFYD